MSDARAYAQRNQRGSDWFSHDASKPAAAAASPAHSKPEPEPVAPVEPPKNGAAAAEHESSRTQMIKPKCDSNQWFKHDKAEENSTAAGGACPQQAGDHAAASGKVDEAPCAGGAAKGAREGDAYGRRDKMGTSSQWFAHEHAADAAPSGASSRVHSKEGGDNASRMRGESENWFNYDGSGKDANKDQHMSKGRGNKPQGDEMRQIFNMGK